MATRRPLERARRAANLVSSPICRNTSPSTSVSLANMSPGDRSEMSSPVTAVRAGTTDNLTRFLPAGEVATASSIGAVSIACPTANRIVPRHFSSTTSKPMTITSSSASGGDGESAFVMHRPARSPRRPRRPRSNSVSDRLGTYVPLSPRPPRSRSTRAKATGGENSTAPIVSSRSPQGDESRNPHPVSSPAARNCERLPVSEPAGLASSDRPRVKVAAAENRRAKCSAHRAAFWIKPPCAEQSVGRLIGSEDLEVSSKDDLPAVVTESFVWATFGHACRRTCPNCTR